MRRYLKALIWLVVVGGVLRAAGAVAARLLPSHGDDTTDTFERVTIFDGAEFASRAAALRFGKAITVFGGLDLDLRGATLDPEGAALCLYTVFGGVRIAVPDDWQIDVAGTVVAGGHDQDRPAPPQPTGRLDVGAATVFGGVQVTNGPASVER